MDVSAVSLSIFRKSLLFYIFNIWVTWKQRLASIFGRCPLLNHLWVRQDPGIPDWDECITSLLKKLFMTSASAEAGQLTTEAKNSTPSVFLLGKELEKERKQPSSSCSVIYCAPQRPRWSCMAALFSKNVIMERLQIVQVNKNNKSPVGWHFFSLYWASSESFSHARSCSDTRTRQTLGHIFKAAKMCTHVDLNIFKKKGWMQIYTQRTMKRTQFL